MGRKVALLLWARIGYKYGLTMTRARAPYPGRISLAVALACALLFFTTVYRNSSGFSPATAARCHSLSTDQTEARVLFAGDFGPLAVLAGSVAQPAPAFAPQSAPAVRRVPSERKLALIVAPFRRPPPSRLV